MRGFGGKRQKVFNVKFGGTWISSALR